mgnify:CR=1 FL=1
MISEYHKQFSLKSDADIQLRVNEKKRELEKIFKSVQLFSDKKIVRVAVLGCADERLIRAHKYIFEKILNQKVELTTFDLSIEHLLGENNVIQHDCTLPLPSSPYDITYGHVLLKFIPTKKQFDLILNSYAALSPGGIAIHVLDKMDYETIGLRLPDGYFTVPLDKYMSELASIGLKYIVVPVKYGIALVLRK